jgi:tRNA threonylcarbamoyladenosine biosynthesis protein TsaE
MIIPTVTEFVSHSVRETESIAADLARTLTGGEVIALYGDLGAGKTQFTRGLVKGLGGEGHDVSSPTFVLLNIYDTPQSKMKVFHLDAYRVAGADDFDAIGFSELLEQNGVVVIEWPTRVEGLLPRGPGSKRINVHLETISAHGRRIRIERLA